MPQVQWILHCNIIKNISCQEKKKLHLIAIKIAHFMAFKTFSVLFLFIVCSKRSMYNLKSFMIFGLNVTDI